jgi:ABC-type nickel/cobalt efflux system permease component RcnA
MSTGAIIAIVVVVVLVVAAAAFLLMPQMRSQRLRRRFGPEYDHAVSHNGDRRAAEKELADRERRHSEYDLHPIPAESRDKYRAAWTGVQERFVDEPVAAVKEADRLVNVLVAEMGYPSEGYDRQLADLSVRHAHTVEHYRTAHETRARQDASTDELRTALIGYRKVFEDLLEHGADGRHTKQDKTEAVQRG